MPEDLPPHPADTPPAAQPHSADTPPAAQPHHRPVFGNEPYPVNLNLAGLPVLVVGAGPVAARKIKALKRAGAEVTVVAPAAIDRIADDREISWHRRPYERGEAGSYRLAVTATDDPAVNAQVASDGAASNVFVNSADDPENCSFTLMSVLRRGDLQVTVSTGGRSPALARWLRRRLGEQIDSSHATLLNLLAEVRSEAKATAGTSELPGWQEALDDGLLDLVRDRRFNEARTRLRRRLGLPEAPPPSEVAENPAGPGPVMTTHIVGASPGEPPGPGETPLTAVFASIDEANSHDPSRFRERPLAQAEGEIASAWVDRLSPGAADEVRIAARAHHLRRWTVPRADYPEGRAGYLRWRRDQKRRHAEEAAEMMAATGYDLQARQRVGAIIMKRRLSSDPEVQLYEDAVALTFLETQFAATADRLEDDHMVEVLRKTLAKMTAQGRAAATDIELAPHLKALLSRAAA